MDIEKLEQMLKLCEDLKNEDETGLMGSDVEPNLRQISTYYHIKDKTDLPITTTGCIKLPPDVLSAMALCTWDTRSDAKGWQPEQGTVVLRIAPRLNYSFNIELIQAFRDELEATYKPDFEDSHILYWYHFDEKLLKDLYEGLISLSKKYRKLNERKIMEEKKQRLLKELKEVEERLLKELKEVEEEEDQE